jgi:hypothetical protein
MYHIVSINSWCKFCLFYFILHCVHHWHLFILLHICTVSTTDCCSSILYLALCPPLTTVLSYFILQCVNTDFCLSYCICTVSTTDVCLVFILLYLHCVHHLLLFIHTVSCNVSTNDCCLSYCICAVSTTFCCSSILYLAMCPH